MATSGKIKSPIAIVCNTVKGKGVSFMENRPNWHNKMPTEEQTDQARRELAAEPA